MTLRKRKFPLMGTERFNASLARKRQLRSNGAGIPCEKDTNKNKNKWAGTASYQAND